MYYDGELLLSNLLIKSKYMEKWDQGKARISDDVYDEFAADFLNNY